MKVDSDNREISAAIYILLYKLFLVCFYKVLPVFLAMIFALGK